MSAQHETARATPAQTNGKKPVAGLFTMIGSCLLLGTVLLMVRFAVPHWQELYASHFGQNVPALTRCVFGCSCAMHDQPCVLPIAGVVLVGVMGLPLVWRSPANLVIALGVLAVGLAMLGVILASTILPITGVL